MCGRFTETAKPEKLAKELGIPVEKIPKIQPRYNIAPSQGVMGVIQPMGMELAVEIFQWGLIPVWAKDPSIGNRMINARAESITEKPSFRGPLKNSRCLIPADGFYEWKGMGKGKQPFYIRLRSRSVFTFAGLWSRWISPTESEVRTCAIVTTTPNRTVGAIHDRMPVILPKAARAEWLDPENYDTRRLTGLLQPYPDSEMESYPVSRIVNDPDNDLDECIMKL